MKHRALLGLAIGLAIFISVMATHDLAAVLAALAGAGWQLSWVLMWRILSICASAAGWFWLFPQRARPAYPFLILGRWIAEAINHL
ncbi:MAG TPA: hypothetical protein VN229_02625, partial [Terriglobales bacterium]|nr:hypothetical protein [Terriglobales bacterium]